MRIYNHYLNISLKLGKYPPVLTELFINDGVEFQYDKKIAYIRIPMNRHLRKIKTDVERFAKENNAEILGVKIVKF